MNRLLSSVPDLAIGKPARVVAARPMVCLVSALLMAGCFADPAGTREPERESVPEIVSGRIQVLPATSGHVLVRETGHSGGEPTMTSDGRGTLYVQASLNTLRSTDDGKSWTVVYNTPFTCDPFLGADRDTGRVFVLHQQCAGASCSNIAWTDDGETWVTRPGSCLIPIVDFLKMAVGPPGPVENPLAGVAYPNVIYICHNANSGNVLLRVPVFVWGANTCVMSYDGGLTWPVERPIAFRDALTAVGVDECVGVTGFVDVGPDGIVVAPIGSGCPRIALAVSRDSGDSWQTVFGPEDFGPLRNTPTARFASDGSLYVMWKAEDRTMRLSRTMDLGGTWEGPWNVTPQGVSRVNFDTMQVGPDGVLGIGMFGTHVDGSPDELPLDTRWNLYVMAARVVNGTLVSEAYQANPDEDPVQVGRIGFAHRNLLDFMGSTVDEDGRFHVVFADGCITSACLQPEATEEDSMANAVRVARLESWPELVPPNRTFREVALEPVEKGEKIQA